MTPLAVLVVAVFMIAGGWLGQEFAGHWLGFGGGAVMGLLVLIALVLLVSRFLPDKE